MRIVALFHESAYQGGAQMAALETLQALKNSGCRVWAVLPEAGNLQDKIAEAGIETVVIAFDRWLVGGNGLSTVQKIKFLRGFWRSAKKLANQIRTLQPDWVITNTLDTPVGMMAAHWVGISHLWYIHEFGDLDHGHSFVYGKARMLRWGAKRSELVIFNSRATQKALGGYFKPRQQRVLYYSMPPKGPAPLAPKKSSQVFELGFFGRVAPGKRQEDAVRALSYLKQWGHPAVRLLLVGCKPCRYLEEVKQLAQAEGVFQQIEWVAFTDEPETYYARADACIVASRMEAFGRVTVEAMQMGCPVLGANSGGTAELIREGRTGYLFAPCSPEDLARQILKLKQNPAHAAKMAALATRWSRRMFRREKHAAQLLQYLKEAKVAEAPPA